MIKIVYYPKKSIIAVSGVMFDTVISYLKKNKFTYEPKTSTLTAKPLKILTSIPELEEYDIVDISDEDYQSLELEALPPPTIKHTGIRFYKNYMKLPPLGEYQKDGIKFGLKNNGIILNWGTGTGKSMVGVSINNHLFGREFSNKLIVVAIGAVLYNWKRELMMFGYFKDEEIEIVTSKNKEPFDPDKKVLIMTYNTYRIISEYYCQKVRKKLLVKPKESYLPIEEWSDGKCSVILDEVHKIKNPKAKRTKWMLVSKDKYNHKVLASATLTPKNFLDIYAPISFIDKNLINNLSYSDFESDICELGTKFSAYGVNGFKEDRIDYYRKVFSPYISYIAKRDVISHLLPNYNKKNIYIELMGQHLDLYKAVTKEALYKIAEELEIDGELMTIPSQLIQNIFPYVMQCLSDPILLKKKIGEDSKAYDILHKWNFKNNQKLEYCDAIIDDHLEEQKGQKFLIWCSNPDTIERLAEYYKKYNPIYIHGSSTPKGEKDRDRYRDRLVSQFETDKDCKMLIANPPTIGVGQNIKGAGVSIFWNRSFSFEEYDQAIGRNDRPNGPWKEIYEYVLQFDRTFEVSLDKIIRERLNLNMIFKDKASISREDILAILTGNIDKLD
jgi:hypothetical protein